MELNDDEGIDSNLRGQYSEKYSKDSLREAIEKIRNNEMSYGAASRIYNVPKTTLHNKMRNPVCCPKGATTILSKDQEKELADWVLLHADFGDPRTKQDIILAAGEIAQLDRDSTSNFKNGTPTSGWYDGFLKRHPLCRERTPQGISKASAINTKDDFAGLWRNIYNYFKKTNQLDLLNKPELWWNADETCFEKDKIPKKVVARRGAKRVSRREMGPPKANTTVTYAFSAAGDYVEPLITLKDSNSSVAEIAFALGSVGANYGLNQTQSGWTKTESFYYFVTMHLHNQWESRNFPKPRILTVDGYGAHFSPKLFRWCRLNDVIIIILYPGATPYMQMCDTTMFSPMKQKHAQLYSQWRLKFPTKTMNDVEFVKLLKQINDSVIKKDSIINGWRATGLQPFNFNNLNTAGLLSKSANRVYDFKGDYCDTPAVSDPQVNVQPSSEYFMDQDEIISLIHTKDTPDGALMADCQFIHCNGDSVPEQLDVELIDVNIDEVPEGPILLDTTVDTAASADYNSISSIGVSVNNVDPISSADGVNRKIASSFRDLVRHNDTVRLSELAGHKEIFQSTFDTNFSLNAFGLAADIPRVENASKIGRLVETIRRDVKQLGILCAANDREKLINVLVINQQLNLINPQPVDQPAPAAEPRSINSILKPPTMPQRVKQKRNMNLKISYGVVTAKEVVDSITERETAERQHECEKELDEIAKHERDTEIKVVEDKLKEVRNQLSTARAENVSINKEVAQKKKNKAIAASELAIEDAAKIEREILINSHDDQLRGLRDKLKELKSIHVAANKAVLLKRKNFELKKKETGNKVQPSVQSPEIDESQLDEESV